MESELEIKMNIIDRLIQEKVATNSFHAAGMLNVLHCTELKDDDERIERCKLYNAWKKAGENKVAARQNAIAGKSAPDPML